MDISMIRFITFYYFFLLSITFLLLFYYFYFLLLFCFVLVSGDSGGPGRGGCRQQGNHKPLNRPINQ